MASALSKYAFINAKLRGRISKILPDELFHDLAKAPGIEEALASLRDTSFADLEEVYSSTGDIKQAELELLKDEIEIYRDIRKYLHGGSAELIEALLYQFEIDNLKNAIRLYFDRKVRKRSIDASVHYILYEPIIHNIAIDAIINADSFEEIAGICEGTVYCGIIKKHYYTVETKGSLYRMEIAFDHFYYENLAEQINKLDRKDRDIAVRLIGVEIDLQNINWVIRLKSFYNLGLDEILATVVPGGFNVGKEMIEQLYTAPNVEYVLQGLIKTKYPGLSALLGSRTSDNVSRLMLIRQMLEEITKQEVRKIIAGYPFTIGIILSYFIMKQEELRKLRMILNAKQYGIKQERIESMI